MMRNSNRLGTPQQARVPHVFARHLGATAIFILGGLSAAHVAAAQDDNGHGALEYYRVVSEKNLFRPLGWAPPDPSPKYALILTAIARPAVDEAADAEVDFWGALLGDAPSEPAIRSEPIRPNRALITELGSGAVFYRSVGEKVGEMTVTDIQEGHITLEGTNGDTTELEFRHEAGGPPRGARGGGPPRPRPNIARPQGAPHAPPVDRAGWRERMERFRNMSREDRENFARQRRGGGEHR